MKELKTSFKYTIKQYNPTPKIFKKINGISMQNTIHKTEENLMQRERRKREKIDTLRVPQPNQEMCAPNTNTRTTTLCRGQKQSKGRTNSQKGN